MGFRARRVHVHEVAVGDKIVSCHTRKKYEVVDLGIMHPEEVPTKSLRPGQVGWVACNMKESSEGASTRLLLSQNSIIDLHAAHIGDTLHRVGVPVDPMPGFKPAKAMVYAGIFPVDSSDFPKLEESIKRVRHTHTLHPFTHSDSHRHSSRSPIAASRSNASRRRHWGRASGSGSSARCTWTSSANGSRTNTTRT